MHKYMKQDAFIVYDGSGFGRLINPEHCQASVNGFCIVFSWVRGDIWSGRKADNDVTEERNTSWYSTQSRWSGEG